MTPPCGVPSHFVPMIRLALATGMRKGEILNLRWAQIDFQRRVIRLGAEDSKNKKADTIALNGEMVEMLKGLQNKGPYVFSGDFPFGEIKTAWRTTLEKADLPNSVRFHDLRHTVATRLFERGADVATVMAFLRHSSLKRTVRYAHPAEKSKRDAAQSLSGSYYNVIPFPESAHREANCASL